MLTGTKAYVLSGAEATLILVAARTAHGVSLFAVESSAAGFGAVPLPVMDLTRRMARVTFDGCPAVLVGEDGKGWDDAGPRIRLRDRRVGL